MLKLDGLLSQVLERQGRPRTTQELLDRWHLEIQGTPFLRRRTCGLLYNRRVRGGLESDLLFVCCTVVLRQDKEMRRIERALVFEP